MGTPQATPTEDLEQAHKELLEDLRILEILARSPEKEGRNEVGTHLEAVREHLTRHFRFEEEHGYMEGLRKRDPRLDRAIDQLLGEHRSLAQSLEALCAEAEAAPSLDESFCDRVRAWVGAVRAHEARENLFVEDAYNVDIAAED
jgi:hypothetical protein